MCTVTTAPEAPGTQFPGWSKQIDPDPAPVAALYRDGRTEREIASIAADGSGAHVMAVIDDGVQVAEYWECDLDGKTYTELRGTFVGSLLELANDPSPDRASWPFGTWFIPL